MLDQELQAELKQYLLLHYRPEEAKTRNFTEDEAEQGQKPIPQGIPSVGAIAAALNIDFLKGIKYLSSKLEMSFSEKLMWWIKKRKRRPVEVYSAVGITKGHFAKIRNNSNYHPSKETVLAFIFALHLTMEEGEDLLRRAGYALSPSSMGDMIVAYFLEHKRYKIDDINEALYENGCKPLTNWREPNHTDT